eukprot:TRINITY_DN730_c1_g1_i7.p1 TRINITY_DN730_c1_g1~~TRINITY_DN730_c1_g1_i7.p1  ORF type:complete len:4213 (+),score=1156.03 TRINITY_DN730_c1_g1_i7:1002-12641(+)
MFLAEDPFRFARRVASAHAGRQEAEALLRYNLYVDSMPTDEIPPLDSTQIKRIMSSALNVKRLKGKRLDTSMLVKEINKDYARTMNKIIFDMNYKDPNQADLFDSLALPPLPEDEDVPEFGTVRIPDHNFPEQFSEFTFHSFLTKPEVINAIVKVRGECNRIQSLNLFNTFFTKSVRMDEFEQMQYQANHQVVNNLKESWVTTLKNAIKNSLRAVGKGWFNLHERNKEVYDISKLKKFMVMINFMMQDSLRFLVESNLEAYASFMENAALGTTVVKSPSEVNQEFESDQQRYSARKNPLFLVDLLVKDNEFTFSTPIDVCEDAPLAIFDKVLTSLQDIPQLEPQVMEDLFWAHKPMLAAVHRGEDHVEGVRSRIQEALLSCLRPLQEYMHTFDEYVEFAKLDPAEYVKQFEDGKQTIVQLKQEVNHHLSERRRIETTIPVSISIGMFTVNCLQLRNFLADKRAQLAKLVLEALAKRARAVSDKIHGEFQKVFIELQKRPDCIEELVSLREYMAKIPAETADCAGWIKEMGVYYDVLEDFKFPLVPEDFNQKWVSYGWPRKISERIEEVDRLLEHDKSRFQTDLIRDKETFFIELEEFQRVISGFSRHTNLQKVATVAEEVARLQSQLNNAQAKSKKYNSRDVLFGFEVTEFEDLEKVQKMFEPYYNLWTTANNWLKWREEWMKGPFHTLDYEQMDSDLSNAWKVMYKAVKFFQDKGPGQYEIATELKQQMDDFKPHMPMVTALRNPGMRDRHWIKIREETELDLAPTDDQTLETLLKLNLAPHMEEISKVAQVAGKEFAIEQALDKMEGEWADISFEILEYRKTGTYVVKGSDDIIQLLDDHIAMTQSMSFSAFKKPFEERIGKWEVKLQLISDIIDEWLACQRNWLYLEPIFSSDDINRQMPTEGKRFSTVDRMWRKVMGNAAKNPSVMAVTSIDKVLDTFQECNKLLDLIQKGLSDYLETKRTSFPRFYFLSNDELLEILSQTKDPKAVQPHLRKCFEAIASIKFEEDLKMSSMTSMEKEVVEFCEPLYPKGNVENWLLEVERVMRKSLRLILKDATSVYKKTKRTEWVTMWPGQVVIAGSQVHWTQEVETALRKAGAAGLERLYKKLCGQLDDLTALIRGGKLTRMERMTLGSLIVIDVHARDVVDRMVQGGVNDIREFEWISQLRYYMDGDQVLVKMVNTNFNYGYEYLGNTGRLVITPLTDRCYITLTGALHLQLGGAPAGPAGTGKTETTKDLAKALARQCVVFNCSDGLDYKMMGRFFSGLAQAGAWACFDEFNRIDIEVLSVIAQQLLTIQQAIMIKAETFMFEQREIALNSNCGFFITMNPGYAGRTELPDNLKALFRPVAMMIPDYALIAEIILFSAGFEMGRVLAQKMVKMYSLCSEQLSQQDHYDFGMRAVKSVLVMAGELRRSNPDSGEDVVLIRAMRDSNVPKFLAEDLPLFQGILQDLFPGVELPEHDYGALQVQIENTLRAKNLQVAPILIKKCIQLYETMIVRHGVMLVGPTGGGKTTCYQVLEDVLTTLRENGHDDPTFQNVESFVLNPKCISMGELYGEFDPISLEWSDGLVAYIIRQVVVDETEDQKWIVFDGPVDALWIENMNTVLDDNKLLCLANSERIKLNNTIHLLFEVADLAVASPATVSRCGMVYMEPEDLGWRPFVQTWITSLPEEIPEELREHIMMEQFEMYIDPGLQFIRSSDCRELLPTTDNSLVHGLCSFFSSLLENPDHPILWDELLADDQKAKNFLNMCFAFSYTWSLGGSIDGESQLNFDTFFRDTLANIVVFPGAGMVYDYFLDFETKTLQPWNDIVPKFEFNREIPYFQMLVPTVDTVRFSYLLDKLIKVQKACLFVGETGVGKSVITQKALADKVEEGDILNICLSFSAQTSSARTQEIIEGKLEKKRKNMRGPPVGKKMVLFVDDINMPKLDTYGAQPPIELLRQYLDFGGFYDREKLFWMDIVDVTLVAACAPPGGGRNAMTARLTRHFNQLFIPAPSENSLKRIFNAIMEGFLEPFQPKVKSMASALVDASVEVYNRISAELLPTPSRSHYTFNLRDLSKVFQGILQARVSSVPMPDIMLRLWCHEEMRVFHDRLIDKHDKEWFTELLIEMLRRHFSVGWTHEDTFEQQPIIFGDFARMGVAVEDRVYEEIPNIRRVAKLLDDYLDEYNMNSKKEMRLVFFTDAIEHVSRIQRIIRQPRGNALLVGVGGCGKRSLTRLACTMAEYQCFEIELTKGYGMNEFRDDLKKLYTMTAVDGEQVVFLLSDTQIAEEEFLEDVNNILNSGEVPNLFETDEYEKLLAGVAPFAREKGFGESRDALHNCMVERVRDNLHIVLTMSPVGELFRSRCRQYPSLVNCCTIDWFSVWPRDALLSVSRNFLFDEDLGSQEVSEAVAQLCVYVHESVTSMSEVFYNEQRRRNYTTPTSYLELINLYTATLEAKRNEIVGNRDRLRNGVKKLLDTNESVGVMQVELNEIQPILKQKSIDTEKLLAQVAKEQEVADGVRKVVMAEEAVVSEQTKETEALAADAQKDLDAALPALEGAIAALNSLNKGDISEIKSFTSPPPLVMLVMEAVCILCKAKPDWPTAKSLLTDANFLKNLIQFDKDNIPEPVLKKLNKYLGDPNFNPTSVGRVSNAAKSLCMWCIAIAGYSVIAKEVAPKRARLAEASEMLRQSQAQLQEKQDKLAEVENQLAALRATYETALAEKVQLSERLDDVSKRIQRASKLISALGEEQSRWETSSENYNAQLPHLVGDVFLSVCCVAYFGAFTSAYRKQLVEDWHAKAVEAKIPCSEKFDLINTVGDPVQIRDWQIAGLPSDDVSVENGILVTQGRRWPLMIDPQGQANRWIKNLETKNNLKVIRLSEPNYLRTLENAIRIGAPVLLEHIGETLDPSLEPILMKQTFKLSGRTVIRIGDTDVDYDPTFRFYITTKLANPHYLPEVCIKVTIINFTVTLTGLEDQLLADVVRAERQELEEQKDRLVVSMAADKRQLKDLEDKILRLLSATEGNILDDEVVINTLNESKVTSGIISVRVKEAEETEVEINIARERYRSVATRGSILYFVLADIANIDPMYQYSLEYFKNLFNLVLEVAEKSEDLETRLKTLITDSTSATYKNVCRGLFDNDKVIFSFMMCVSIMLKEDKIPRASWMYLLRGNTLINRSTQPECDADWVTPKMWDQVVGLQTNIKGFDKLVISLNEESQDWKTWFDSDEPHKAKLPGEWDTSLDDFQRMLVVRALRPEKVMFSITEFVIAHLGPEFVVAPPFDLESVFGDTHATSPIILILSPGADPTDALLKFAKAKEYSDRMHIMSLGQGQGPLAAKLISKATMRGDWVLLQNCHLAASWMPSLEKIIEGFHQAGADIHEDFRLWLTSMPTKSFPVSVLQAGVKLTNEAPKGLVNNLTRSFHDISAEQFEGCTKPTAFKKLLFGLVFFHGLLLERRKFGPLGWNITYEFTDTDRQVGMSYLKMILELEDDINWKALRYLTGDIIYGGRVTDDWDRRCLKSILDQFYHADFLVDGFKITKSGVYRVPDEGPQESFLTYIASLPVTDPPEVFGLHDNANISYQNQETDRILTTISNTQPRDNSASTAQKPEEIVADLATEILGKLPKALSQDEATSTPGRGRSLPIVAGNSLSTVLLQEMVRFNKLLRTMSSSLVQLGKAIKGMVVMSEQLEAMFYSMLNNEVPQMWATVAYPSLKPLGSWVTDLHKRIQFLRKWLSEGQPPAYWLPGFFFPQGFMTGVLQNHARKYQIPIDTLSFSYSVLKTEHGEAIVDPPEDGVFVYGLFFDGGRWDRERRLLGNSLPGEIHSTLPVIHFKPTPNLVRNPEDYNAPLYKTSRRAGVLSTTGHSTNFVVAIDLPTDMEPAYWIRQGTALLCALND